MLRSTRIPILLLTALGFGASQAHAFELVLAPDNVSPPERPAIEAWIAESTAQLPPKFKAALTRPITIRFVTNLDSTTTLLVPPCRGENLTAESVTNGGNAQIRGMVVRKPWTQDSEIHEISLNAALKSAILAGPEHSETYACGHHTTYALAEATLLHELSHLYDFSGDSSLERDQQIDACTLDGHTSQSPTSGCPDPAVFTRSVSHNPTFKSIVTWTGREFRNELRTRSPDPYEFTNLEESFAVNMEYFLLDPEYSCRKPSEFDYLKTYFGFDPYPSRPCRLNTKLNLSVASDDPTVSREIDLDPSRIYQIHFLLAGKGKEFDSAFGHAMFRIITCAPTRKEVGPDCLNDIQNHVVVTFRANQGDWHVDGWKGLAGGYPSQMFLLPFYPQIVNEYTLYEPRDLISLPIRFSPEEQTRFIERVIEQFWTYQGRYYFVTNNCGTEALHLLKATLRDPGFQDTGAPTPIGLYQQLLDIGRIEAAKSSLFASTNEIFDQAFQRLAALSPSFHFRSLQDYMTQSTPEQRIALYQELKTKLPPDQTRKLTDRFFILESYIFVQARAKFTADLSDRIQNSTGEVHGKFEKMLELQRETSPLSGSNAGYGIPEAADFLSPPAVSDPAVIDEIKSLTEEVMQWARSQIPSETDLNSALEKSHAFFLHELTN